MPPQRQTKRRSANQPEDRSVKRTRVSRACDQCRVARERCDGAQPVCSTCSANTSRACSYTANPKKRGIQPGYIRTLELSLAYLFQQDPDNETFLSVKLAEGGPSSLLLSRDSKESNKLHRRWRKARFYTDIDTQLSGEPSRHDQSEHHSPDSSDEASDKDAPFAANMSRTQDQTKNTQADAGPSGFEQLLTAPEGPTRISLLMPPDSWKLFEAYFTDVQCWLPICEKHDVLKSAYSYPLQGLPVAGVQPESGSHAELWSILAVASVYGSNLACVTPPDATSGRPTELYATAKFLIPSETERFEIGHVKALLNLVVFNMAQSRAGAAWVLIGRASRVLDLMDQPTLAASPRFKHVHVGCFLLDSMLSLQLKRRPHFRKSDLEHLGAIAEDGLEEWQPWSGFDDISHEGRKTPLLSLSIFNNLIELVDLLINLEPSSTTVPYRENIVERLERWRVFLPAKLRYLCSNPPASIFLTPPSALLMATHHCVSFASNPSDMGLHRLLEVLEQCQERLGPQRLPPTIRCLMSVVNRQTANLILDNATQARLNRLQAGITAERSQPIAQDQLQPFESSAMLYRYHTTGMQMSTPDSLPSIFPNLQAVDQLAADALDTFMAAAHSTIGSSLMAPSPSKNDPRYPEATSDLESFFDELASLDSATRPDNQPQFMQNLGFGPDASMAELFSEYIPLQSSALLTRDDTEPVHFGQYGFYDPG